MEFVSCIVCHSKNSFSVIENVLDRFSPNNNYTIQECTCGMIMLNPRPNSREIQNYYQNKNYHPKSRSNLVFNKLYKIAQNINNKIKKRVISKYCKEGSILDYGGGDGQFQNYMSNNGWNADVYEPYLSSDICNQKKIINMYDIKDSYYNVVTMFHSLEHIHEIDKTLEKVNNSLVSKGILVLAIPNHDAYERKFFGKKWIAYDVPRHLFHFNYQTVKKVLNRNQFQIIEFKPMYLDTFYNILMSINKNKFSSIIKIAYSTLVSYLSIFKDKKKASSIMLICKKNES